MLPAKRVDGLAGRFIWSREALQVSTRNCSCKLEDRGAISLFPADDVSRRRPLKASSTGFGPVPQVFWASVPD